MYVLELRVPGSWLADSIAPEPRRDAEALFLLLESALSDVAISLTLFEEAMGVAAMRRMPSPEDEARARRAEETVRTRYADQLGAHPIPDGAWARLAATSDAVRAEIQRERWRAGEIPWSYRHRLPFLHARTFIYALDTIGKALLALQRVDGAPEGTKEAADAFYRGHPSLVHVRDSAHHPEDRVRGKVRGKSITLRPIMTEAVNAPHGGVLIMDQLANNRYGGTLADGSFGEVEVSVQSAQIAQQAVQAVFDAWPWRVGGFPRLVP